MKRFIILAAFVGLVVWGCASQKAVTPPPQSQEMQPQQSHPEAEQSQKGSEKITEQPMAKIESTELPSTMVEISGVFKDILFDYDKYDIREDEKRILKAVADYLRKKTTHKVLIEGHCDERGTSEYNLALADKRAKAAKDFLVSLGVPSSFVDSISYGKERPICTEHSEECWAKNRRDHFVVLKGK